MDRITVISFGPLGLSIGLGLARLELNDTEIVASSGSSVWRAQAKKSGAFARIEPNLANVLKDTDLIVVDVPTVDVPGLFKVFGEKLNDAVIVTDTGLSKRQTIQWAQEYFGQRIQFVGGTPLPMKRMVSIDDATIKNGCLEFASGHNQSGLIGKLWKPLSDNEMKNMKFVPIETKPGDAVFFDCYTPHKSESNLTNKSRRILYLTYNKLSDGNYRTKYYEDKYKNYPPDIDRNPDKKYNFKV